MADNIVLLDSSILIDYYRKTDKNNAARISLIRQGYQFVISAITKYEIYSGAGKNQLPFWDIAIADLFIASTALTYKLPMATLNKKHFERIDKLIIIE